MAASGALGLVAITRKPVGNWVSLSPWLIHTPLSSPVLNAEKMPQFSPTVSVAGPYSRSLLGSTLPPSCSAISCSP